MLDETNESSKAIELSNDELDTISAGQDISFSFSFFKETDLSFSQEISTGKHGSSVTSSFQSRNIVSFTFQAVGLDISNAKFLKRLLRGL